MPIIPTLDRESAPVPETIQLEQPEERALPYIEERRLEGQLRHALVQAVCANARLILTGPRGIGKSFTVNRLLTRHLRELAGDGPLPCVIACSLIVANTARDTFLAIARQAEYRRIVERVSRHRVPDDALRGELLSAMGQHGRTVLVIDEAHNLSGPATQAILDLLAEADDRAGNEAREPWLGVVLIASTPHDRALLSRIGARERIQNVVTLNADALGDLARYLVAWIPELRTTPEFSSDDSGADWIARHLGNDDVTLRTIVSLASSLRVIADRLQQRGPLTTQSLLGQLTVLARQYIGHQHREGARVAILPVRRKAGRNKKRGTPHAE